MPSPNDYATGDWGDFDWGDGYVPPIVDDFGPNDGTTLLLRGPGELAHQIIGPGGVDFPEYIEDFEYIETAGLGYDTASGMVEADRVKAHPGVYVDGAKWIVTNRESGAEEWVGYLFVPTLAGAKAQLKAWGTGKDFETTVGRIPYQVRAYGLWSAGSGDPYNMIKPNGEPLDDDLIQIAPESNRILFTVQKGSVMTTGDRNRIVAWLPGEPGGHPTRIFFHLKQNVGTSRWTIRILTGKGPQGALTQRATLDLTDAEANYDIDFTTPGNDDLIAITLQAEDNFTSTGFTIEMTQVRVNFQGIPGDFMSTSSIMADLASRMGFNTDLVQESGFNGLPFDTGPETRAESMDRECLLTDWRWLALGDQVDVGPWDTRTFYVLDPEIQPSLVPVPKYDQVRVSYLYPNSTATGEVMVTSDTPLLKHRIYPNLALPEPAADKDQATQFGERVLTTLMGNRVGGTLEVAELIDGNGHRVSAATAHAGDTFRFPNQLAHGRARSKTRTNTSVTFDMDDRIAMLETLLARRRKRMENRGEA